MSTYREVEIHGMRELAESISAAARELGKEGASGMGAIEGLGVMISEHAKAMDHFSADLTTSLASVAQSLDNIASAIIDHGRMQVGGEE